MISGYNICLVCIRFDFYC